MQDLSNILLKLSQRILNVGQSRKLKIAKLMLNLVDHRYFTDSSLLSISTFSQLNKQISLYYRQKFNEKINESLFYEINLDDKFIAAYKLIMDLAINGEQKELFLNAILDMTENEKNLLMEFVGEVVKRHEFICESQSFIQPPSTTTNKNPSQLTKSEKQIDQAIYYEQKFHQLKQEYKQFQKIYYELLDQHQSLKKSYDKINSQLGQIKQEKFQLLDDLGLHHNAGFADIIDKYRKDVDDFAQDMAKMHRELDQKNLLIKTKEKQNQQLILSFSIKQQQLTQTYEQKSTQLIKKQSFIQKKLQQSIDKQQELKFQILRLKDVIVDLRKELQEKNNKLLQQQEVIDKFNKMKKLHLEFRKVMIQNYRSGLGSQQQHSLPSAGGISL